MRLQRSPYGRCNRCRRPRAWLCAAGRPCERVRTFRVRKSPRYGHGQREALRRYWLRKHAVAA